MIRLDIHEYCDACCDFDPDVTKPTRSSFATELNKVTVVQTDTIVTCKMLDAANLSKDIWSGKRSKVKTYEE